MMDVIDFHIKRDNLGVELCTCMRTVPDRCKPYFGDACTHSVG